MISSLDPDHERISFPSGLGQKSFTADLQNKGAASKERVEIFPCRRANFGSSANQISNIIPVSCIIMDNHL